MSTCYCCCLAPTVQSSTQTCLIQPHGGFGAHHQMSSQMSSQMRLMRSSQGSQPLVATRQDVCARESLEAALSHVSKRILIMYRKQSMAFRRSKFVSGLWIRKQCSFVQLSTFCGVPIVLCASPHPPLIRDRAGHCETTCAAPLKVTTQNILSILTVRLPLVFMI